MAGSQRGYVTRVELLAQLAERGARLSLRELKQYQASGVIPALRRFGRKGEGRGVAWGWPRSRAERIVKLLLLLGDGEWDAQLLGPLLRRHSWLRDYLEARVADAEDVGWERGFQDGREDAFQEMREGVREAS